MGVPNGESSALVDPAGRYVLGRTGGPLVTRRLDRVWMAVHGDVTFANEFESAACETAGSPVLDAALATYETKGIEAMATALAGTYYAVVVDATREAVFAVNDRLGTFPMYWTGERGVYAFAPGVLTLLRAGFGSRELDLEGAAQFLRFGHLLGNKTLVPNVELVPPGTILELRAENKTARLRTYFEPTSFFERDDRANARGLLDNAVTAFVAATEALTGPYELGALGISLSGGLDSRAILAALGERGRTLTSYTCGVPGCADERIGAQLARTIGATHRFLPHREDVLSDVKAHLNRFVASTEGMYLSHGLTELHDVLWLADTDCSAILRGHGGELAKTHLAWPFHTAPDIDDVTGAEQIVERIMGRMIFVADEEQIGSLVGSEHRETMLSFPRRSLSDVLQSVSLTGPDLCTFLYLTQHHRRFTAASLQPFREKMDVLMPFVEERFLRALLCLPVQARTGTAFHREIINRVPALGSIVNSNTGAPANAGPIRVVLSERLNQVASKLGVSGFRHYHELGTVMRERVLPQFAHELTSADASLRYLFPSNRVRALTERVRRGSSSDSMLLLAVLTLELWQQRVLAS